MEVRMGVRSGNSGQTKWRQQDLLIVCWHMEMRGQRNLGFLSEPHEAGGASGRPVGGAGSTGAQAGGAVWNCCSALHEPPGKHNSQGPDTRAQVARARSLCFAIFTNTASLVLPRLLPPVNQTQWPQGPWTRDWKRPESHHGFNTSHFYTRNCCVS